MCVQLEYHSGMFFFIICIYTSLHFITFFCFLGIFVPKFVMPMMVVLIFVMFFFFTFREGSFIIFVYSFMVINKCKYDAMVVFFLGKGVGRLLVKREMREYLF